MTANVPLAGPAYGLIRKVVRDPAQSEEVAQEVPARLSAEPGAGAAPLPSAGPQPGRSPRAPGA